MIEVDEKDLDKITETLHFLLKGHKRPPIEIPPDYPENELRQLTEYFNRFLKEYRYFATNMSLASKGILDFNVEGSRLEIISQLKTLQGNLKHLTWKTQQIAEGDFEQKVDFMGDFSVAFNSMTQQLREAFAKIEQQKQLLQEAFDEIKREKEKSDKLLLNILPVRVADDLKVNGRTMPETFDHVTVAFSDIVGFTNLSAHLDPKILIDELNEIFTGFDLIIESHECERIKTIGDAYLAVSGMNGGGDRHPENIVDATLAMLRFLENRNRSSQFRWQTRIGVHTGKVVGGVVGIKKYIYDVFGDTINTASRMEQNSEPMMVNISETTYRELGGKYDVIERGNLDVKGKGEMKMYFVTGRKNAM